MPLSLLPFGAVLPATAYSLLSLWCGWRFFKGQASEGRGQGVAISILKPVKGLEEDSYQNFASFCSQTYSGAVQLIFAVAAADDPVVPVIRQLMADFPNLDISLQINATIHGPNSKVSNLINAYPQAKYDLLMVCDSDIRVTPTFLRSVTAHFGDPQMGLVSSPYRSSKVFGVATALEALAFTSEMIPNVLVARQLEGLSFALGAAMTFRRRALDDIGGLPALVDYLADDYQLGHQVNRAGWKLALDRQPVESILKPETMAGILQRQLRWARTMRVSRPGGYLASGITLPGLAILLALFTGPLPEALAAIVLLYSVRLSVTTCFSRYWLADRLLPAWGWLLPLRDLLAFATWLFSFLGNRVSWRGQRFIVRPGGRLSPLD
jgi:ceramide glucosyltransferase